MGRPKKTDDFIVNTLRNEIAALKRQLESFERESERQNAAIWEAENRGIEAQRVHAQSEEDRRALSTFCRIAESMPGNLILTAMYARLDPVTGMNAPHSATIGAGYLQDIATRIQRMGVT